MATLHSALKYVTFTVIFKDTIMLLRCTHILYTLLTVSLNEKIYIFLKKENKSLYSSKAYIQMVNISILVTNLWLEAPLLRKNEIMRQRSKVLLILNASCNDSSRVTHLQSQVSLY